MTKIDFYYWDFQCPYNGMIIDLLKKIDKESNEICLIDVSHSFEAAKRMHMYSPTLLAFDDKYRWNGPITMKIIKEISEKNYPEKRPYSVKMAKQIYRGRIYNLTEDNAGDICTCCSPDESDTYCKLKGKWIEGIMKEFKLPNVGVLHYKDDKCIGGAEFVPSVKVPYDVPKGSDIAFLTCSYLSGGEYDYKSYPLEILESELHTMGYKKLEAVTSLNVVFPNGPLSWFIERGYKDLGLLYYEKGDFAEMHLVQKAL